MPLRDMHINCSFGKRIHPVTGKADFHRGVDLHARTEPVFAILDGKISAVGFNPILGKFIRINHGGLTSVYGHLSVVLPVLGDTVLGGDIIGVTGATGRVTGEHLHFSIHCSGKYLDPILFFLKFLNMESAGKIGVKEYALSLGLQRKLELLVAIEEVALSEEEAEVYGTRFADMEDELDG